MQSPSLLAALTTVIPRLLLAQQATPPPDRRPFYVELRVARNECEIRYQTTNAVVYINPFPLTVGYYLTSRLAVQLSGAYGTTSVHSPGSIRQDPSGTYITGVIDFMHEHWAVPVGLRYAVLPKKSRLQVDALLGLAWAHDSFTNYSYSTFNGAITGTQTYSDDGSQIIGTAGVGVRWVFSRHFELLYDHAWNRNLDGAPPYIRQNVTGNVNGLTDNRALALRYRFNWGKPTPKPAE